MNKIEEALTKKFQKHRLVFWYDEKEEFTDEYESLNLRSVEKIKIEANEFEIKFKVQKGSQKGKFLLYSNEPRPANEENWLLDLELAHSLFHTNQEALHLQELGLDYHFKELVSEHIEFFRAKDRRNKFKSLLATDDTHQEIRYKILAVVFGVEYISLVTYLHAYATEFISGNESYTKELDRFGLTSFFWKEVGNRYGYQNEIPSIYDFLIEVFQHGFVLKEKSKVSNESKILLSQWKDAVRYQESFTLVSDRIAGDINLEEKLTKAQMEDLLEEGLFRLTDKRIIHELSGRIAHEEIAQEKVSKIVKSRENKFWYEDYKNFYKCLYYGSHLIHLVRTHAEEEILTFEQGLEKYRDTWYSIDLDYRKFIFYYRKTQQNKILSDLHEKIEKVYSNDWLLKVNDHWQKQINSQEIWPVNKPSNQRQFFAKHVSPILDKDQRLFVIISDALRFECGAELNKTLQQEQRYTSSLEYLVASLPSYTQLGMASLLPNKELSLKENSDSILVDGLSSSGVQGRRKILEKNSGVRATAIRAEDFMKMNSSTEGRSFAKQYDLIYIYHNRIDKTGDDKTTEDKVFEAVAEELDFIRDLVKKIANVNGNNIYITSDHGFIYQHQKLPESDFMKGAYKDEIKENRRFVLGKKLTSDQNTVKYASEQLGIKSDMEVLIPKSINRLRVQGAGSRFVHGGASLQEIVIPLLKISRKRKDTTTQVDVDIIKSGDRITTNLLPVSFIQSNLVNETTLPRTIRSGIHAEDKTLLSDQFKYVFDIEEGSERQREVKHRFQLSSKASGEYKNQRVKLVLEEPVANSSKWREYKTFYYTLNISFTNDFDDF